MIQQLGGGGKRWHFRGPTRKTFPACPLTPRLFLWTCWSPWLLSARALASWEFAGFVCFHSVWPSGLFESVMWLCLTYFLHLYLLFQGNFCCPEGSAECTPYCHCFWAGLCLFLICLCKIAPCCLTLSPSRETWGFPPRNPLLTAHTCTSLRKGAQVSGPSHESICALAAEVPWGWRRRPPFTDFQCWVGFPDLYPPPVILSKPGWRMWEGTIFNNVRGVFYLHDGFLCFYT